MVTVKERVPPFRMLPRPNAARMVERFAEGTALTGALKLSIVVGSETNCTPPSNAEPTDPVASVWLDPIAPEVPGGFALFRLPVAPVTALKLPPVAKL